MSDYKIYILRLNTPNLGDYCNEIIMNKIIVPQDKIEYICITNFEFISSLKENDIVIGGIGSIFTNVYKIFLRILQKYPNFNNLYVLSSGVMSNYNFDNKILEKINFLGVRGVMTQQILQKENLILGDLGILISKIINKKKNKKIYEYEFGIIPHAVENCINIGDNEMTIIRKNTTFRNNKGNILFIDICSDINKFVDDILKCKYILSSSLHGIIFSESFSIPSYHIKISNMVGGGEYKFRDYFSSYNREYTFYETNIINNIISNNEITLSEYNKFSIRNFIEKLTTLDIFFLNKKILFEYLSNKSEITIAIFINEFLILERIIEKINLLNTKENNYEIILAIKDIELSDKVLKEINKINNLFYFFTDENEERSLKYASLRADNKNILKFNKNFLDWNN